MIRCNHCPDLMLSRRKIVPPTVFSTRSGPPQVLGVAEAPGIEEDKLGVPMVGPSGQEARHHFTINGITSLGVTFTNMVLCHPNGNRDPKADEITACTNSHLIPLILKTRPRFVITMGRVSTRWFLGDVDMEMVHGIPHPIDFRGLQFVVIPVYHPAAGLHDPSQLVLFHSGMQIAGDVIRGRIQPRPPVDSHLGREEYVLADDDMDVEGWIRDCRTHARTHERTHALESRDPETKEEIVVAVDTEWARGEPYLLSLSVAPGKALVVRSRSTPALASVRAVLEYGGATTIIHNALYDLPVLEQMGIRPARTADTMVMAYLLQVEPQGLKPLAYRHCGMKMSSYEDMVGEAGEEMARWYLEAVVNMEWPNPKPVLEWAKGEPKVRQPQNVSRKVKSALAKGDDLYNRWSKMDGTEEVRAVLGEMQRGELCDIPQDDAVRYSARDADATIRLYPVLWERILNLGLEGTFWRDMKAMPMVVDMMANGMPVNLVAFERLGQYLQKRLGALQRKMQMMVGGKMGGQEINPASSQQMATLIYDVLKLHEVGGRYKPKRSTAGKSTADDVLKRYLGLHQVVEDIITWRGYHKMLTSYAVSIPRMASPDGRIRTTLRMTRVATGRLSSSKPNLMAQPVRSEEGRMVRDCYEAPPGRVLVSGDYSQVEMRVAANDAKDERMMRIFWTGEDIHRVTASSMFGVSQEDVEEMKHRYPAKRVGFGILNLITAEGLQRELTVGGAGGWTLDDCKEMIEAWFKIYPGVAAYMKENGEYARRRGYVRDMWGRIRYIPGIRSTNRWLRIEAERQAGNAPIQMGAQGIIKEAMGRLVPVYRKLQIMPLIQIHDDIVWEMEEWMPHVVLEDIRREMVGVAPPDFIVPLEVDFKVGARWGSMVKWKGGNDD